MTETPAEVEPMHRGPVRPLTEVQIRIWDASPYSAVNQRRWARRNV